LLDLWFLFFNLFTFFACFLFLVFLIGCLHFEWKLRFFYWLFLGFWITLNWFHSFLNRIIFFLIFRFNKIRRWDIIFLNLSFLTVNLQNRRFQWRNVGWSEDSYYRMSHLNLFNYWISNGLRILEAKFIMTFRIIIIWNRLKDTRTNFWRNDISHLFWHRKVGDSLKVIKDFDRIALVRAGSSRSSRIIKLTNHIWILWDFLISRIYLI